MRKKIGTGMIILILIIGMSVYSEANKIDVDVRYGKLSPIDKTMFDSFIQKLYKERLGKQLSMVFEYEERY